MVFILIGREFDFIVKILFFFFMKVGIVLVFKNLYKSVNLFMYIMLIDVNSLLFLIERREFINFIVIFLLNLSDENFLRVFIIMKLFFEVIFFVFILFDM